MTLPSTAEREMGKIDLCHAIAFSDKDQLDAVTRDHGGQFFQDHAGHCYSLTRSRSAPKTDDRRRSIVTLTYYGAEK